MADTTTSTAPSASASGVLKRQWFLAGFAILIVAIVALAFTYFQGRDAKPAPEPQNQPRAVSLVTGGGQYAEKEAWRQQTGADIARLTREIEDLARMNREGDERRISEARAAAEKAARESLAAEQAKARDAAATGAGRPSGAAAVSPPLAPPGAIPPPIVAGPAAAPVGPPPTQLPPPPSRRPGQAGPGGPGLFDPPISAGSSSRETIATVTFDNPAATKATPAGAAAEGESGGINEKQPAGSYVPAGSFARVVILNGLDAPTGGQSQSNPHPVLLRIIDPATMPNGFRVDLKNCMVSAEGTGDLAAERAMVRLSRLSCIDPKGGAIDIQVRGYVAGEDGKAGMRGQVVTKTGQILANALLASIGSGIGEAFKAASETTTTTPLGGVVTTTTPGEGFQRGFGAGTQRAFDMLARYYLNLAEKVYPVVAVDGGRVADIVFTRGFVLEGR